MKHKTLELEGELLDKAVLKAMGRPVYDRYPPVLGDTWVADEWNIFPEACAYRGDDSQRSPFSPSRWWEHAGPIIERERISINSREANAVSPTPYWAAKMPELNPELYAAGFWSVGPTPLIAAMRAFVLSKLGEEVDLP